MYADQLLTVCLYFSSVSEGIELVVYECDALLVQILNYVAKK